MNKARTLLNKLLNKKVDIERFKYNELKFNESIVAYKDKRERERNENIVVSKRIND